MPGTSLTIRGLRIAGEARLVADGSPVALAIEGDDTVLTFSVPSGDAFAPAVVVEGGADAP